MSDTVDAHRRAARSPSSSKAQARETLSELLSGTSVVHAISVAASLGVADLLERGPRSVEVLARATRTHRDSLYRLLRALSAAGVFAQTRGRFALTPLSDLLRTRATQSMRSVAALTGAPSRSAAFDLEYSVRTGKPAFDKRFGAPFYDYLSSHRRERRLFADVMTHTWRFAGAAILGRCDFSGARVIVDVGGGSGAMIESILRQQRTVRGVVVETPAMTPETRRRIRAAGLARRCDVVSAVRFRPLPRGGDVYILAFVIHNWSDTRSAAILRRCRRAMAPDGRVIVIESPLDAGSPFAAIHDLEMLLFMRGGRERSLAEYRGLFKSAGLTLRRAVATGTTATVMEAVRATTT